LKQQGLPPGAPVLVYLLSPREKVFGILVALLPAGLVVRGIDLSAFEDWMRQERVGEEDGLSLVTLFFPMHRVERVERDESVGGYVGFADRFRRETGRSVTAAAGLAVGRRASRVSSRRRRR
jgi:hypothetical protein